jgi:hypothetical protein
MKIAVFDVHSDGDARIAFIRKSPAWTWSAGRSNKTTLVLRPQAYPLPVRRDRAAITGVVATSAGTRAARIERDQIFVRPAE